MRSGRRLFYRGQVSTRAKTFVVWLVLIGLFLAFFVLQKSGSHVRVTSSVPELFADAEADRVSHVTIDDDDLRIEYRDGRSGGARLGRYRASEVRAYLAAHGVDVVLESSEGGGGGWWIPLAVLVIGLVGLVVFLRRAGAGTNVFSLRKATAKLHQAPPSASFADVGGNEELIARLKDVVGFLREPKRWTSTGARPPRGILLEGPPGHGKTLLARALAGEAKVALFTATGSDFIELFVGVGAARVRDLFEQAQKHAPCIVFIDELDAIGRKRGGAASALTHQEREQALLQLLSAMDGFAPLDRVIVVAATNRADVLDSALLRPGRFDVRLKVAPLDEAGRHRVLAIHTRTKKLEPSVDLPGLAQRTPGYSGAALEHLANEAAIEAVRAGRAAVAPADLEVVLDRREKVPDVDLLDAVLIAATHELSRPEVPIPVVLELREGKAEGELLWADAKNVKLKLSASSAAVFARESIVSVRAKGELSAAPHEAAQVGAAELGTA